MSADLLARYGRRFVQSARERLATAKALDGGGALDAARALALHLHSISGEAAMIGLPALSQAAREAMGAARAVDGGAAASDCATHVAGLLRMLDEIEGTLPPPR